MAGLNVNVGGGRSIGSTGRLSQGAPATIAQTAYGAGSAVNTDSNSVQHWHVFMGAQVAAVAWLAFLRWSLPSGRRSE